MDWLALVVASFASALRSLEDLFRGKLAEWLTAFATMTIAVFAYLENERRKTNSLPAVETTIQGRDTRVQFAPSMRVRNRSTERGFLTCARIVRPAGFRLAVYPCEMNGVMTPGAFASDRVDLSIIIHPRDGSTSVGEFQLSCRPPSGWPGGKLFVELTFETRGSTIRSQRLLVLRTIQHT
jgi:hypothetical protein